MSEARFTCLKCGGDMQLGYTIDRSHAAAYCGHWTIGLPKKHFLSSLFDLGISLPKFEKRIPIGTFRCQLCGFLESYALNEFEAT